MHLLEDPFSQGKTPAHTYDAFWAWFQQHEKTFHQTVRLGKNIEAHFFDQLSPRLDELHDGFNFVTGMLDDNTVELILTPDGIIKNMVFTEELVQAAPAIPGWKFTALKPALNIEDARIEMSGYQFDTESLSFYSNDHPSYPDEIDLTIVHRDYQEADEDAITTGIYIFLDNYLGELNSVSCIDNLSVTGPRAAEQELIPIHKLKDFLVWREKEFLEKYEGRRYQTENDTYSSFQAELENGRMLLAIVNTTLLEWDVKASHPWILTIEIRYDGDNNHGMPDQETYERMDEWEEALLTELRDADGYLSIGRQTADNSREIYFACQEFRKPSKVVFHLIRQYADRLDIRYDFYKDKYWKSFERFRIV